MKVAIIGGGLAGFSCAHELEMHGITPVIYERNGFVGEPYPHCIAILGISHRPIKDSIKYFSKNLNINVTPLNTLNSIIHNAPHITTNITGNLGYLFKFTTDSDSLKNQIYSKLKNTEMRFNEVADYQNLSKQYDYVVVATGNYSFTQELGCWQEWLQGYLKGAVVLGDFNPNQLIMWLNKDYCKNGYAYLTPYDSGKANLVLVVTDVNEKEVEDYWQLFLDRENIKYKIVEEFKIEHRGGFVYPLQVDNIFFTGNSAGGLDPFLGFGAINATTTGVAVARTIALGQDYEKQVKTIIKRNAQMRQFRKVFNNLTNKDYDNIVSMIGIPVLKHWLYSFPLNINVAKYGAFASKFVLDNKKGGKNK